MNREINRFINTTSENPEDFYETLSEILVKFGIRDVTNFIIDYYADNISKVDYADGKKDDLTR